MIEIDDQICVGQVGINYGLLFLEKELGWMLYDGYEGYGYVFEVVCELYCWVFQDWVFVIFVSYVDLDNYRFVSVVCKLGGVLDLIVLW